MYHDLRQFYNQVMHPELLNLERRRRRLVWMILFSGVALLAAGVLAILVGEFVFTLFLMLPIGFWISHIVFKAQVFFQ